MIVFTNKEARVISYLKVGYTDKEIAKLTYSSERTAKAHVQNIKEKLSARNRTVAALMLNGVKV
jgi:DNA-binding NarL/FixJ family response regulator